MKKIGITQRVEVVPGYGEKRDCLDQKWSIILDQMGLIPVPLPNSVVDVRGLITGLGIEALLLTGGNDIALLEDAHNASPERDEFEAQVLGISIVCGLPLVGVCRGLQIINRFFGGRICRVGGHVAKRHIVRSTDNAPPSWPAKFEVNSFHKWGVPIDGLGSGLMPTVLDAEGYVEGLQHENLGIRAVMWHPEREIHHSSIDMEFLREGLQA